MGITVSGRLSGRVRMRRVKTVLSHLTMFFLVRTMNHNNYITVGDVD